MPQRVRQVLFIGLQHIITVPQGTAHTQRMQCLTVSVLSLAIPLLLGTRPCLGNALVPAPCDQAGLQHPETSSATQPGFAAAERTRNTTTVCTHTTQHTSTQLRDAHTCNHHPPTPGDMVTVIMTPSNMGAAWSSTTARSGCCLVATPQGAAARCAVPLST